MKKSLRFREDKTFKILQFTDIHFTEDNEKDHKTVELMEKIIGEEQPDFIITTGDTVYGKQNMKFLPKAMAPITKSGIPWTFTFGNHDVEFAGNHKELYDAVMALEGSVAYHDPDSIDGTGNHVIHIEDKDGKTKWLIFAIDSGDYIPWKQVGGYACVTPNQIRWYQNVIRKQEEENSDFSALAFQHMAIPEFADVFKYELCYGVKREGCGSPRINSGFFYGMLEAGHTKGLFVGHDHANDYYGKLFGITLGYGRATGYNTYGAPDHMKGARVFVLKEDKIDRFETYVRLENGLVIKEPWGYAPLLRRDEG